MYNFCDIITLVDLSLKIWDFNVCIRGEGIKTRRIRNADHLPVRGGGCKGSTMVTMVNYGQIWSIMVNYGQMW